MSEKKKIAVRTCGGCFCKFDRRKIIETLKDSFQDSCEIGFNYDKENDGNYDLILLINGCDSECAEASEITENLIIDHTNWERAEEVFAEKLGLDS